MIKIKIGTFTKGCDLASGWTPWCWGNLAKRLFDARAASPRSLLAKLQNPETLTFSLSLTVSFLGLNIALSPNLIGLSDADFHIIPNLVLTQKLKNTKKSFGQTTVDLSLT